MELSQVPLAPQRGAYRTLSQARWLQRRGRDLLAVGRKTTQTILGFSWLQRRGRDLTSAARKTTQTIACPSHCILTLRAEICAASATLM